MKYQFFSFIILLACQLSALESTPANLMGAFTASYDKPSAILFNPASVLYIDKNLTESSLTFMSSYLDGYFESLDTLAIKLDDVSIREKKYKFAWSIETNDKKSITKNVSNFSDQNEIERFYLFNENTYDKQIRINLSSPLYFLSNIPLGLSTSFERRTINNSYKLTTLDYEKTPRQLLSSEEYKLESQIFTMKISLGYLIEINNFKFGVTLSKESIVNQSQVILIESYINSAPEIARIDIYFYEKKQIKHDYYFPHPILGTIGVTYQASPKLILAGDLVAQSKYEDHSYDNVFEYHDAVLNGSFGYSYQLANNFKLNGGIYYKKETGLFDSKNSNIIQSNHARFKKKDVSFGGGIEFKDDDNTYILGLSQKRRNAEQNGIKHQGSILNYLSGSAVLKI